jgi:heme/copper-type cytochrome/quinol oxidase subunit 2
MTMGMGLLLIAIGAILRYAVKDEWSAVDLTVVGLILMIVGVVAFVVGAIYAFGYSRSRNPSEAPPDPRYPPDQRY